MKINTRKSKRKNITLPSGILAFKLLRKANITKEKKLLVLTGMNYDIKKTLYEKAKNSLKQFKGATESSSTSSATIKLEPTYLVNSDEAYCWVYQGNQRGRQGGGDREENWRRLRSSRGGTGAQEFPRTEYRRQGVRGGYQHIESGSQISQPNDRNRKNINPVGPDGHTLTCTSCGSYRHLLHACPDSWENMAKINIAEEEHAVLFTGYNTEEVQRLEIDARNCAVLDSACSSTVCEDQWINNYIQSLDNRD